MFPLYIWLITGVLTAALIFFVFAQAALTRSSGQSAADAAALAAAQEARDLLYDDFLAGIGEDADEDVDLGDILDGLDLPNGPPCAAAERLADRNDAALTGCDPLSDGYRVVVDTRGTVGESLIPGTESLTATAEATAVIRGLCELTEDEGQDEDDGGDEGGDEEQDEDDRVDLRCDEDRDWSFDPGDEGGRPEARDLFRVYLED
ncbi:pilus assembly protein TadG-related protein [Streptomyces mayteni]